MSPRRALRFVLGLWPLALLACASCASSGLGPPRPEACDAAAPPVAEAEPATLVAPPDAAPGDRAVRVNAHAFDCSGALITPDHVLTARHCVVSPAGALLAPTYVHVTFGSVEAPWGRVTARALVEGDCSADVALVVLDRPVLGLVPFSVRRYAAPRAGEPLEAIGYGSCDDAGSAAPRHTTLFGAPSRIGPARLTLRVGTCPGDSGSPLVVPGTDEVVGVVTAGAALTRWPVGTSVFTFAERLDDLPRMFARAEAPSAQAPDALRDAACDDRRGPPPGDHPVECFGGWCE